MGRSKKLRRGPDRTGTISPGKILPDTSSVETSSRSPSQPRSPFLSSLFGLNALVFWAGAVLMGLEIVGSRLLAPHFGNSVFVWGSLISIFLVAISAGNYLGGRIVDRSPSYAILKVVGVIVSASLFSLSAIAHPFCNFLVGLGAGEQVGPLLASLVLFLPPSLGMGMVSPFAIRLATSSVSSVGRSSGSLYALSTLGSIVGTVLTTFVLIPLVGSSTILKCLGLILLLASVLTFPSKNSVTSLVGLSMGMSLVAVLLLLPAAPSSPLQAAEDLVVDVDTPYHHIAVIDNARQNSRELRFDRFVESAVQKSPPYPALADYTMYFHTAFLAEPGISRTLFIGAGGAVGPRAFHMHNPQMEIDVVDIDPKVLELARTHFYLESSPRIRTIAKDGRLFLRDTPLTYDCIVLDAFTIGGRIPFHLVTKEFFESCAARLGPNGVFVMNINSALAGPSSRIFQSMSRTMETVFPCVYAFAKDRRQAGQEASINIILLATKRAKRIEPAEWAKRAEQYESASYVKSDTMIEAVHNLVGKLPDAPLSAIFTDDYAPIETMPF